MSRISIVFAVPELLCFHSCYSIAEAILLPRQPIDPICNQSSLYYCFWNTVQYAVALAPVWGTRVGKPSAWAIVLQYFRQFKEILWPSLFRHICSPSKYNCCNNSQYARPAHVTESWAVARLQVLPNSGSWMFTLKVKTLSEGDRHWQNSRKTKL